jgi:hypothetical protein
MSGVIADRNDNFSRASSKTADTLAASMGVKEYDILLERQYSYEFISANNSSASVGGRCPL